MRKLQGLLLLISTLAASGWRADATLGAQAVRGTVQLQDAVVPVAGAIIVFETPAGQVVGRALSDARGAFYLRLPGGVYRTRALRVGFQPSILPTLTVAESGTTPFTVQVSAIPVLLPSVRVRSTDVCRGDRSDGAAVAAIWEEARKALIASELSSGAEPLIAEWVEYERTLDAASRSIRSQRVRSTRSATTHAFRSAPWDVLAATGYVVDAEDGTVFHAPDADVLLSDSFAALHCFHVEPPGEEHPTWIGVGFRPARERRGVSDIEGTFWIDRTTNELRTLEFRYTNLPSITERVEPGGRVEFQRLGSGSWLVNRWSIRMPQLAQTTSTTMRRRNVTVSTAPSMVAAVRIVGGEVSRVERGDTTVFALAGASPSFRVHTPSEESAHQLSMRDVRITLDGTDYETITDARGVAVMGSVLPGRYQVRAQSPLMDFLGVLAVPQDVMIRAGDSAPYPVAIPNVSSLLTHQCGMQTTEASGALLRGVVVDTTGMPLSDAALTVSWQRGMTVVNDRVMGDNYTTSTRTDSLGLWKLCGVPREVGLTVRVNAAPGQGEAVIRVPPSITFASSTIVVHAVTIADSRARATSAQVAVLVTDSAGQPLSDARVSLTMTNGRVVRLRTDTLGRARHADAGVGVLTVDVRKLGYETGAFSVEVERGDNTIPIVLTMADVPRLATVRVVGDRVINTRHAEFERRLASRDATHSITAEDIDRRNPVSTWQMLTRVPSIMVVDSAGEMFVRSSRMSTIVCWPRIAIDGLVLTGRPNMHSLPPPSEIYGIEVFAGSARLPVQYGGDGDERYCGLIAIWTK